MFKPRPAYKLWMEADGDYVFGPGVISILKKIQETGTLKQAAIELDMSYRYAWGLVKKAEEKLSESLIITHKGGRSGGGNTELTKLGMTLIEDFQKIQEDFKKFTDQYSEDYTATLNFTGEIIDIDKKNQIVKLRSCNNLKLLNAKDISTLHIGEIYTFSADINLRKISNI